MRAAAQAHRMLPPHPASVRAARSFVREVLDGHVPTEMVEVAESVTSELMTNAVVHAGTAAAVDVRVESPGVVYVAVTDGAPHHPVRPRAGVERSTGRGLALVGSLSREWGVELQPGRKVVWCRLDAQRADAPRPSHGSSDHRRTPLQPGLEVVLANVPLQLYRSWLEDAEALLRDFLLAGIELRSVEDSLRRHAACSEAFALLVEAVAAVSADEVGPATRPEGGHAKVTVSVPRGSVEDFRTLDEVLESAIQAASGQRYLSAATSPAARRLRRWICREVRVQSVGGRPTAWEEGVDH